jgi:hypothetical protein
MSDYYGNYCNQNNSRRIGEPVNYRVRLTRYGPTPKGPFTPPQSLTVYVSGTSSMQARTNAQGSYPGYSVTDVMEA